MRVQGKERGTALGVMLKGVSRRVVVIAPEDQDVFEQAIFIVKDVPLSQKALLKEACDISAQYLKPEQASVPVRWGLLAVCFLAGLFAGAASILLAFMMM